MARHVEIYVRCSKEESKTKMGHREPKLDNARQLRGIFFVEPNDEEFKLTIKAARRKLEVPMPAAMPCKIPIKSSGETRRSTGKHKTKYTCVVDADESTRPRLEGAVHKHHDLFTPGPSPMRPSVNRWRRWSERPLLFVPDSQKQ